LQGIFAGFDKALTISEPQYAFLALYILHIYQICRKNAGKQKHNCRKCKNWLKFNNKSAIIKAHKRSLNASLRRPACILLNKAILFRIHLPFLFDLLTSSHTDAFSCLVLFWCAWRKLHLGAYLLKQKGRKAFFVLKELCPHRGHIITYNS